MLKKDKRNNGDNKIERWHKAVAIFVMISLLVALVFSIIAVIVAPSVGETTEINEIFTRGKSEYILILLQSILGIFAMFLPNMIEKKWKLDIPSNMLIFYIVFLYASIVQGEFRNYYYLVPHWDTMLHAFSGIMFAIISYSVINLLNKSDKTVLRLSPIFVAIFTFCFAGTLGVLWEIYEYAADGLFELNMQKFMLQTGEQLVGREALRDTMKDLRVDLYGALGVSIFGFISLKTKNGWIERVQVRKKKEKEIDKIKRIGKEEIEKIEKINKKRIVKRK